MNFEKWYSQPSIRNRFFRIDAYNAWVACKKEVLEILNKNKFRICDTQLQEDVEEVIDLDAIKEIEKL